MLNSWQSVFAGRGAAAEAELIAQAAHGQDPVRPSSPLPPANLHLSEGGSAELAGESLTDCGKKTDGGTSAFGKLAGELDEAMRSDLSLADPVISTSPIPPPQRVHIAPDHLHGHIATDGFRPKKDELARGKPELCRRDGSRDGATTQAADGDEERERITQGATASLHRAGTASPKLGDQRRSSTPSEGKSPSHSTVAPSSGLSSYPLPFFGASTGSLPRSISALRWGLKGSPPTADGGQAPVVRSISSSSSPEKQNRASVGLTLDHAEGETETRGSQRIASADSRSTSPSPPASSFSQSQQYLSSSPALPSSFRVPTRPSAAHFTPSTTGGSQAYSSLALHESSFSDDAPDSSAEPESGRALRSDRVTPSRGGEFKPIRIDVNVSEAELDIEPEGSHGHTFPNEPSPAKNEASRPTSEAPSAPPKSSAFWDVFITPSLAPFNVASSISSPFSSSERRKPTKSEQHPDLDRNRIPDADGVIRPSSHLSFAQDGAATFVSPSSSSITRDEGSSATRTESRSGTPKLPSMGGGFVDAVARLRSLLNEQQRSESAKDLSVATEGESQATANAQSGILSDTNWLPSFLKTTSGKTTKDGGADVTPSSKKQGVADAEASAAKDAATLLRQQDKYRSPTLPVVFCHGLFGFDTLGPKSVPALTLSYWRGVVEVLEANGTEVLVTRVPASASIEDRAKVLRSVIEQRFAGRDINLIGHSMGGLDGRYLISRLESSFKIRSLTTIATPHRGSYFADWMLDSVVGRSRLPTLLKLMRTLGVPGGGEAFENLTREAMAKFNKETPDMDGVKYYSWGAAFSPGIFNEFRIPHGVIHEVEGDNDGMVSVESSRWGSYRGTLNPVSHLDLIGWVSALQSTWDPDVFRPDTLYLQICEDLADEGF